MTGSIAFWQRSALALGVACLAGSLVAIARAPERFLNAYLTGLMFWTNVSVGLLFLLLLQLLLRSDWGRRTQPLLEAGVNTFPLLALLFLPLLFGIRHVYAWASQRTELGQPLPAHLHAYFSTPFFAARALGCFALWWLLSALARGSRGSRLLGGWGLVLLTLSSTLAAVDWVRSLAPSWKSSTFGCYFITGQAMSALCMLALLAAMLRDSDRYLARFTPECFHDLGKSLLAFLMLWAYIAFTQFLIIWSGNIPAETRWYVVRSQHGWQWLALALIAVHFALPFVLLLPRALNRSARVLAGVALLLLCMRVVDLYWLIAPAVEPAPSLFPWPILLSTAAVGGLWMALVLWRLRRIAVPALSSEAAS